jgi:hypothetical protein
MAIDFPDTPATGQSFTVGAKTWVYDGEKWVVVDSNAQTNNQIYDIMVLMKMETN